MQPLRGSDWHESGMSDAASLLPPKAELTGLSIALHYNHMDKNNNEITLADIKATLDAVQERMATKDDLKGLATQAALDTIRDAVAETKESVTEAKGIMQDMLEELNATHADVRYIRSTVDALVRSDIAHDAAIEDLAPRVHRLEQKAGLAK